jgi:cell division protease FtsH
VLSPKELALTNGSQPANGSARVSTAKPAGEPVDLPEDGGAER